MGLKCISDMGQTPTDSWSKLDKKCVHCCWWSMKGSLEVCWGASWLSRGSLRRVHVPNVPERQYETDMFKNEQIRSVSCLRRVLEPNLVHLGRFWTPKWGPEFAKTLVQTLVQKLNIFGGGFGADLGCKMDLKIDPTLKQKWIQKYVQFAPHAKRGKNKVL